jgi:hypothetical protein
MKKKFLLIPGYMILSILTIYNISNNSAPEINWQNCIGGTKEDYFLSVIQLRDGNFLYCGAADSKNGDFTGSGHRGTEAFLLKVDDDGREIWKQTYGGSM